MSRTIEFVVILDDGVRKRHRHHSVKGKVASFMIQLEVCVGGENGSPLSGMIQPTGRRIGINLTVRAITQRRFSN
jgi:hypothetical protein